MNSSPFHSDYTEMLSACIAWKLDLADRAGATQTEGESSEWLEKYRRERALLPRFERRRRKGQFVRAEYHKTVLLELCGELRNTLLSWPSRLAPIDDKTRVALREEVHNLLRNFQKWEAFADPDKPADQEPTDTPE